MRTSTKLTLAVLLSATAALPAMAVTPLVTTITNNNSNTTTALKTATRAAAGGGLLPNAASTVTVGPGTPVAGSTVNITKFDTTTGILVGAQVSVSGVNVGVDTRLSATVPNSGNGRNATSTSSGWTGSVSGVGFSAITSGTVASSTRTCAGSGAGADTCKTAPAAGSFATGATSVLSGTRTIDAASLDAYAAADQSSVALSRTADGTTSVGTAQRTTNAVGASRFGFTGGTYSLTYDYLKNAVASFDGTSEVTATTLDFGRVVAGSGPVTLSFTLYNLPDAEGAAATAGLQLLNITRGNSEPVFTTNSAIFTNLVSGNSVTYSVTYNPLVQGTYSDTFTFNFIDYAKRTGDNSLDGLGLRNSSIELTVLGGTVPEPQTWAMLLAGFGMVGFASRRRRATVAA